MKKYQLVLCVFLMACSSTTWAFFGIFYSDEEKKADLQHALLWLIESGVDIYANEGKEVAESRLLESVTPALSGSMTLKLGENVIGNKDELFGGSIGGLSIEDTPDRYEANAVVLYRTQIEGDSYEYWRVKVHTDRNFGKDRSDLLFVLVKVVNGSEKRTILHQQDHFFDKYEVALNKVFSLPLDNISLLDRIQPGKGVYKKYFKGTPLENVKMGMVNGKWGIITYDAAAESLKKRKKELKKFASLSWWLPKEGIAIYEKNGVSGLKEKLKATYLDLDIQVEEENYKDGVGKVFTMKEEGALFQVYLVVRTEFEGEVYEYWYLEGLELGEADPLKHDMYVVAKVDLKSKLRESLQKDDKPFLAYTTKSGSVISLPDVDSVIRAKQ